MNITFTGITVKNTTYDIYKKKRKINKIMEKSEECWIRILILTIH